MARADIKHGGFIIEVVLSERNLLTLLSKLHTEGSNCSLTNGDVYRDGKPVSDYVLSLKAEKDEAHYGQRIANRGSGPGPMHPVTERILEKLKEMNASITEEDND